MYSQIDSKHFVMDGASASSDDEDPVVSVALRKRRRASAIAAVLHGRGDAEDDEASGEDGEDESGGEGGDDDVCAKGAHPPDRVARMRRVVESIELSVRNVGLSPDYVALAEPELAKLQATCKVYANQAISDRWSEAFVSLLKRSRMMRVQTVSRAWKAVLRERPERCQVCGTREHKCRQVFELVGVAPTERAARPLGTVHLREMAEAYNDYDDADDAIGAGRHGIDEYFGMFACGNTCFEKVVTAFLAHNFVADIAYEVRRRIDAALARDPALLARWERDERDPKALIEPIVARERVLQLHLLPSAPDDAARREQLAHQDGARGLDRRRRVVQVRERHHRVVGDGDLARRARVDGRERARVVPALALGRGVFAHRALAQVHARRHGVCYPFH